MGKLDKPPPMLIVASADDHKSEFYKRWMRFENSKKRDWEFVLTPSISEE